MKIGQTAIVFFLLAAMPVCQAAPMDFASRLDAARSGNVEAMCDVAMSYYYGKQTLKDPFKAKCWVKKAYDKGSKRAETLWNSLELWQYSGACDDTFDDEPKTGYRKGNRYVEPFTGIRFVYIPGGCFQMGCSKTKDCRTDAHPSHRVCLEGFWMGIFEVTQEEWQKVVGNNPSLDKRDGTQPVENVSFDDVLMFLQKVNAQISDQMSLPTEAQWEYACKSGRNKNPYPFETQTDSIQANCGTCNPGHAKRPVPVGTFAPNAFGLYDMGGNVKEWCRDFYDRKAYATHRLNNPVYRKKEAARVIRGGSFLDNPDKLSCAARDKSIPGLGSGQVGFRLVLKRYEF